MDVHGSSYLRFAALGDSLTYGIGDPVASGYRGWARLLATALTDSGYDVSFCNVADPGATSGTVLGDQLSEASRHRPDLAALVVGFNDVLKTSWDPARMHDELVVCAEELTGGGATLMTVRFHDHTPLVPLPERLRARLRRRIEELNEVWDGVHARYGGFRVDLGARPEPADRRFWAVDRLHPSELGHRCLARAFADELRRAGLDVAPPAAACAGGLPPSWRRDAQWILAEGGPWLGRRARDLAPWAAQLAVERIRVAPQPRNVESARAQAGSSQ